MGRARSRLATFLVMIDLHGRGGAEGACGIAIEGIRVASEVRRHGPHRAAARPAALRFGIGPNVWALMRPGERFKRPRVNEQIGSPIQLVNAPRRHRGSADGPSPSRGGGGWHHRRRPRRSGGSVLATPCFGSSSAVTPSVTLGQNLRVGSTGLRPGYGRGSAGLVNERLIRSLQSNEGKPSAASAQNRNHKNTSQYANRAATPTTC
jgi:hypothetical protein